MKLRLRQLPAKLADKEQRQAVITVRELINAALAKAKVECYVIDQEKSDLPEQITIRFSNNGPDSSKFPIQEVWTIFVDRMTKNFARKSLNYGMDFAFHGVVYSGTQYTTTLSTDNTIMVTTSWSTGLETELTITIHAQGPNAKACCMTEIDPKFVN